LVLVAGLFAGGGKSKERRRARARNGGREKGPEVEKQRGCEEKGSERGGWGKWMGVR
jgi:hypothetical protein